MMISAFGEMSAVEPLTHPAHWFSMKRGLIQDVGFPAVKSRRETALRLPLGELDR